MTNVYAQKAKGGEGDGDDENKPKGHKGPYKVSTYP